MDKGNNIKNNGNNNNKKKESEVLVIFRNVLKIVTYIIKKKLR